MRVVLLIIVLVGAGLRPAPLAAEPIAYSEQNQGELPWFATPLGPELRFGLGQNTVTGQISGFADGHLQRLDFDSFAFVVPLGSELMSVRYEFDTAFFGGNEDDPVPSFELRRGNGSTSEVITLTNFHPSGLAGFADAFAAALPVTSGVYHIGHNSLGGVNIGGFTRDYVWTFDVQPGDTAPVPEPATLLLFGTGAALAWRRRRSMRPKGDRRNAHDLAA